jgi:ABC-type sugar transport system ATPase subunit
MSYKTKNEGKKAILQIKNVSKYFGGLTALNKVSFDVHEGEVVALLGDNGAGKSTLIKCISGVHKPDKGEILFNGESIETAPPDKVREVGIETIYQDLAIAEKLDVGANVFLGKEKTKRFLGLIPVTDDDFMREEAAGALERLDIKLPDLSQKLIRLSGGQRQAVAIARALYWDARLIIMDEPTAALGVPEQRKVLSLVRSLRDENIPVIIISHTMQDVMEVADRIIVLLRGRKVADLPREEATVDLIVKYIMGAPDVIDDEHQDVALDEDEAEFLTDSEES